MTVDGDSGSFFTGATRSGTRLEVDGAVPVGVSFRLASEHG